MSFRAFQRVYKTQHFLPCGIFCRVEHSFRRSELDQGKGKGKREGEGYDYLLYIPTG